jgi:hypothetical protein
VPTRLYLTDATAPVTPASITYTGGTTQGWEEPTYASGSYRLLARADNWPGAVTFITNSRGATNVVNQDIYIRGYVSDPLTTAQSISGTLSGQALMRENNAGMDAHPQIMVKVISGDGATLRGVLFGGDSRTTNVDELTTLLQNRQIPAPGISPVTLSSVAASSGDRILIEVGVRANAATTFFPNLRFGATASPGGANDLSVGGAETTDLNCWIEFSQTLSFGNALSRQVPDSLSLGDLATPQTSSGGIGHRRRIGRLMASETTEIVTFTSLGIFDSDVPEGIGVADNVNASESGSGSHNRQAPDSVNLTDTATSTVAYKRTAADSVGVADNAIKSLSGPGLRQIPDTITLTDLARVTLKRQISQASLAVSDSVNVGLTGAGNPLSMPPEVVVGLLALPEADARILSTPLA